MTDLFEKNLNWLRNGINPQLAEALKQHTPNVEIVGSLEENDINIKNKITGELLYKEGLKDHIQNEFEAFVKTPPQYHLPMYLQSTPNRKKEQPDWDPFGTEAHYQFFQNFSKIIENSKITPSRLPQDGAYLALFGLGLGYQIFPYLQQLKIKSLIIYEPNLDYLFSSFSVLDWAPINDEIQRRGGEISFIHNPAPQIAGNQILHKMRDTHFHLVDGSYYPTHYESSDINNALNAFKVNIHLLCSGYGNIEDEIRMYLNTAANLKNKKWKHLKRQYYTNGIEMPAFIVGSGPSLDNDIEFLKKNRDRICIFSCGTALSTLIKNEIIPDFHCEIENQIHVTKVLEHLDPEILKTIPLICPTSVMNVSTKLFKDVIYTIRDSVTPTRLFFREDDVLKLAPANVSSMATVSASLFGFLNIYFLGIDLGSKTQETHHSKDSIYMDVEDDYYNQGFRLPKMIDTMPGQRGTIVHTNPLYSYALHYLNLIIQSFKSKHNFYNGSDGVLITGTQTIITDELQLKDSPYHPQDIVQFILNSSQLQKDAKNFDTLVHKNFEKLTTTFFKTIQGLTTDEVGHDFETIRNILKSYLLRGEDDEEFGLEPALRVFTTGSFLFILQMLNYVYMRITPEEWEKIWPQLRQELHKTVILMQKEAKKMFETVEI